MLYYNTVVGGQVSRHSDRGAVRYEMVPIKHQAWIAARALCAGDRAFVGVRAFPRHWCASSARLDGCEAIMASRCNSCCGLAGGSIGASFARECLRPRATTDI